MSLEKYKEKRDFKKTSEPKAQKAKSTGGGSKADKDKSSLKFCVQKHAATNLHYDFRLELEGALKSWAVPKGPSLDPKNKRLAMMVEDHPYDYRTFEGIIPKGEYGGGEVIVWDEGVYHSIESTDKKESEKILKKGLEKGDLKFVLEGQKLKGEFVLVKMKNRGENQWLLIKHKDDYVSAKDILKEDKSVLTGRTIEDIKNGVEVKKKS